MKKIHSITAAAIIINVQIFPAGQAALAPTINARRPHAQAITTSIAMPANSTAAQTAAAMEINAKMAKLARIRHANARADIRQSMAAKPHASLLSKIF
ncbi:MAG: hypothetical protein IJ268_08720 [Proteobacteria bacterium]|nr:hypothetical protein [Pseudomonadota bacterium]